MLRVLVVLPMYGGSLPIGRYCIEGLKEAGCLVESFEAPAFYSAFSALKDLQVNSDRLEALRTSFLQVISQAIIAKADRFKPDLVLAMAQAPLSRAALKQFRKDGVVTCMWFVEDFRLFTYWQTFAPFYDVFAVIQKEPFLDELTKIGVPHALYLPMAALPSFHKALELSPQEKSEFGSELSFLGAGYPNRLKAFLELRNFNFKIWGTEWDDEPALSSFVQRQGERICPEDAVRIYNASRINLNLHSSIHTDNLVSQGDFVNPRTFELAASGVFQLVDQRTLLPELFSADELATFTNLSELKEKIRYFLDKPEERKSYQDKARARVLRDHTYKARMETLLAFVKESIPGFGLRAEASWPEEMPEDMKISLNRLFKDNSLPPMASFDDVVTVVRDKRSILSDLECAVLFLDEWEKLYKAR